MTKAALTMSQTEVERLPVLQRTVETRGQAPAARQLGLSGRQIKRLVRQYRSQGAAGLGARRRGQRPPKAWAQALRDEALAVSRERYPACAPTLAHEQLTDQNGDTVSVEPRRQGLRPAGLWPLHRRRGPRVPPRRPWRPCVGEWRPIDGSPHAWGESRAPACPLIVCMEAAPRRLMALRFVPAATTQASMETFPRSLAQYGRPMAIYSDQHRIFRVNQAERDGDRTQFSRALETLDIAPIHAHTPHASSGRTRRGKTTW